MLRPLTLLTISALSLVAAGAGVALGRSAVAEIRPFYFTQADPPYRYTAPPHATNPIENEATPAEFYENDGRPMPIAAADAPLDGSFAALEYSPPPARAEREESTVLIQPAEAPQEMLEPAVDRYATFPVADDDDQPAYAEEDGDGCGPTGTADCAVEPDGL
jgi:hypothetical protein